MDQKRTSLGMLVVMAAALIYFLVLSLLAQRLLFHPLAGAMYLAAMGLLFWSYWRRFMR